MLTITLLQPLRVDWRDSLSSFKEAKDILNPEPFEPNVGVKGSTGRVAQQFDVVHRRELRIDMWLVEVHV